MKTTPKPIEIFVKSDLIEDRLDATFYHPKFYKMVDELKKTPYKVIELRELCTDHVHRGKIPRYTDYVDKGIPIIKTINLKNVEIDWKTISYVSHAFYNNNQKAWLKKNDILLASTGVGSLGKVDILENDERCMADGHLTIIRVDEKIVNPRYLLAFLRSKYGQMQIERRIRGYTGQIELYPVDIETIKVSLPPKEIQDRIAEITRKCYEERKQKLQRREMLLNSVNNFIFKGLHIRIIEVEKERFIVKKNDLEDRLDPLFYHTKYTRALEELGRSPYEIKTIGEISREVRAGKTPPRAKYVERGVPFLRIQNITKKGIEFGGLVYLPNGFYDEFKRAQVRVNNIVIAITGATIGKAALIGKDVGKSLVCADIAKIVLRDSVNPLYVLSFLRSPFGQLQIQKHIYGATNKHVSPRSLEIIRIPIPPKEIQDKIADRTKEVTVEAEKLRKEVGVVTEKTKREVLEIIQGRTMRLDES